MNVFDRAEAVRRGGTLPQETPGPAEPRAPRDEWKSCPALGRAHRWVPLWNNCARYRCATCGVVGYRYSAKAGIGPSGVLAVPEEVTPYLCDTCHGPATIFVPGGGHRRSCQKCRAAKK